MFNKIHNTMDEKCERVNNFMGVSIKLSNPSKHASKVSVATNGLIGSTLILFGVLSSHKWTILLGALGLLNSLSLLDHQDKKKKMLDREE